MQRRHQGTGEPKEAKIGHEEENSEEKYPSPEQGRAVLTRQHARYRQSHQGTEYGVSRDDSAHSERGQELTAPESRRAQDGQG
jgi:hypothetical protein